MPINLIGNHCLLEKVEFVGGIPIGSFLVPGNVLTIDCIPIIVQNVIFWLLVFAGTAALILLLIGGIKFITSGGDPKQTEGARKTLTYAILGLILILLSFAIIRFIAQVTGVDCITKFGFICEK